MKHDLDLDAIDRQLAAICDRAIELESQFAEELEAVHPNFRLSARNLLHYLALRQFDIRSLQDELVTLGLSSLGRAEPHVLPNIQAVRRALRSLRDLGEETLETHQQPFRLNRDLLKQHTEDLLGPLPKARAVSIMVTLPSEAADNFESVRDLIDAGMDVARINTAHDDRDAWHAMVKNIRRAEKQLDRECRIVMDLAGPKFRTGPLRPAPKILRLRPKRDELGQMIHPRRIRLVPDGTAAAGGRTLPVTPECIEAAHDGDKIRFHDTRGRKRTLHVMHKDDSGLDVALRKTAYIASGTELTIDGVTGAVYRVGELPAAEQPILVGTGDTLLLDRDTAPGEPARLGADGAVVAPAHVSLIPAEIIDQVGVGERVSLNDGKIEGLVEDKTGRGLTVRITHAKATGSRLRSNRGVNFPDSDLHCAGLTASDIGKLGFVARHADVVGLSFVRSPDDLVALHDELHGFRRGKLGVIAKIETEQAFEQLPRVLLAAMRRYPAGVMIARGDLAVECGWVRLAVMQEEILWLCQAAHLPVIWATQVLESETKKGRPSRAEITDAAMSQRADCVMLNKGPHIVPAIRMLDDILRRMQHHQHKKSAKLPRLKITKV